MVQNNVHRLDDVSHQLSFVCFCTVMSLCSIKQVALTQGVQMLNEPECLHTVFDFKTNRALCVSIYS